jgi:heme exporter protein A
MTHRQVHKEVFLKVEGLALGRGELVLARDVSLNVAPKTGLLLRGPNGAGKSTLLLTLAGLLQPISGTISFVGHDEEDGPVLHHCGHRNAVRARLLVRETLQFWAAINGHNGLGIDEALERVGLTRTARLDAAYLSAGQQRRLALGRLLVSRRPVWLLDEPSAALDADGKILLETLLAEHLADGGITVIATHDDIGVAGLETLTLGKAA